MAKINHEQLERLKKIQDADDDDLELDVTNRRTLQAHKTHHNHKANKHDSRQEGGSSKDEAQEEEEASSPEDDKKDTRNLLYFIGAVVGIFAILILLIIFGRSSDKGSLTIDELHQANLEGKLKPEQGYMYHGYSFVNMGGIWYSQVQKGDTMYDITFNNGPKDVQDIPVEGMLSTAFQRGGDVFITFDPTAASTKYITVANAGLSLALAKGFQYNLTATCTDPERSICQKNGAVTCNDEDKAVIYFKEGDETKIILDGNCVIVQGYGMDIVRAKDRLLMRWYGILE